MRSGLSQQLRYSNAKRQRGSSSPVTVNNCIEGESIPPAAGEVGDPNAGIALSRPLGPAEECLFE